MVSPFQFRYAVVLDIDSERISRNFSLPFRALFALSAFREAGVGF